MCNKCLKEVRNVTIAALLFHLIFGFIILSVASAGEISNDKAIRAIIGEASGEGYAGMLAVAAAIRNRGSLRGVYGITSGHIDKEPPYVWARAEKAWKESKTKDPTAGATHWESIKFKVPYWASSMDITCQIGNHIFYKERRS